MLGAVRAFNGLASFERFTARLALECELPFIEGAGAASHVLYENAIKIFGDNEKLAPLAPSTQAERERLGYTPDEPLLRDGQLLRDKVERLHDGFLAAIGSPELIQLFHEMGYSSPRSGEVPARPVFLDALTESKEKVEELMSIAAGAALGFYSPSVVLESVRGSEAPTLSGSGGSRIE